MNAPPQTDELKDSLAALVTAWKNLSAYPPAHPARRASLANAHRRIAALARATGALTFGVSRDGLTYGSDKLTTPNVRSLSEALHYRGAAVLTIDEAVRPEDLEHLLVELGEKRESGRGETLADLLSAAGVSAIGIETVDYAALGLAGLDGREPANLWEAILDAMLRGKQLDPAGIEATLEESYSAEGIAALLAASASGEAGFEAYGDTLEAAVGGYLGSQASGARQKAVHQVAELVRALPKQVRERVLAAALRQVTESDEDASHLDTLLEDVSPDDALAALRRLSGERVCFSQHALRLVQTLAAAVNRARAERTQHGRLDTDALATELSILFRDEDIDRYNPDDHQALVEQAASIDLASFSYLPSEPLPLGDRGDTISEAALEAALLSTLLELVSRSTSGDQLERPLGRLRSLFERSLSSGHFADAIVIVEECRELADAPETASATREALSSFLASLASSQEVMGMVGRSTLAADTQEKLAGLITSLGDAAARSLLGALASEKDQSRRRRLFNLLVSLGDSIVPEAKALLRDSRWYVVRNMLALLRAVGDRTSLEEVRRCARDQDLRVRLEAIKTLLAFDPSPPIDLLHNAISDPDPKLAEAAVSLTGQYGIREARDPLVATLTSWDVFGARRSVRLKALKALSELGESDVLPELERFFKDWRLPLVSLEERRMAFRLLEAYPESARAPYLEQGLASRDKVIRDTCRRLAAQPSRAARESAS